MLHERGQMNTKDVKAFFFCAQIWFFDFSDGYTEFTTSPLRVKSKETIQNLKYLPWSRHLFGV